MKIFTCSGDWRERRRDGGRTTIRERRETGSLIVEKWREGRNRERGEMDREMRNREGEKWRAGEKWRERRNGER